MVEPRTYAVKDDRKTQNGGNSTCRASSDISDFLLLNTGLRYDYYLRQLRRHVEPATGRHLQPYCAHDLSKLLLRRGVPRPERVRALLLPGELPRLSGPRPSAPTKGVFEQYLGDRDRLSVSVYRLHCVDDLITQLADAQGELYFDNIVARNRRTAPRVEFERKYDSGTLIRASYAWQKTREPGHRSAN